MPKHWLVTGLALEVSRLGLDSAHWGPRSCVTLHTPGTQRAGPGMWLAPKPGSARLLVPQLLTHTLENS